ncbi:9095_t:CDS:1, partial [Scutellospora calospora]
MLAIIIPIGYIVWIIVNWGKLHLRLLKLFSKNSKEKKNSSSIQTELPIDHNEDFIIDDSAPPTYEEAIAK